jgi:lipoprotein-anchoring transpeptidase ErfK/SrfK
MSRHRATQVRYGRLGAAVASLGVTLVAVLGGFGVLPVSSTLANASEDPPASQRVDDSGRTADQGTPPTGVGAAAATKDEPNRSKGTGIDKSADSVESQVDPQLDATLPEGSGTGKRVVFSESRQRVWLVDESEQVVRTYLASGSVYDNLDPGTFTVYSRSEDAWGVDNSGSMKYFVRFTQGDTGAAIGFHDIPVKDGQLAQTEAQLGTPRSHGCIRQRRSDAVALWEFAPLGTSVIVTA